MMLLQIFYITTSKKVQVLTRNHPGAVVEFVGRRPTSMACAEPPAQAFALQTCLANTYGLSAAQGGDNPFEVAATGTASLHCYKVR